jgi:SAM-dependent methyltransferase
MFDSIIRLAEDSNYDFREFANPNDPLRRLFPEWIKYYRLKWAIAKYLQPTTILEVGVRFGYSARAFLDAAPQSRYLGLDLDSDCFGGVKGAIGWAGEITKAYDAKFQIVDTQSLSSFPGDDVYDLIHVDGQQDGKGSYHDLELALNRARFILMDGYLWTRENFLASTDFLFQYRGAIEFFGTIPGYAGELLIKVSEAHRAESSEAPADVPRKVGDGSTFERTSAPLRASYTRSYYTQDCGGFDSFNVFGGRRLEDPRLQIVALLSTLGTSRRVLDLGCGRGELAYYFARQGAQVTAVDYSDAAIALARECLAVDADIAGRVSLICGDVCSVPLTGKYDLAVASDLVEHLAPGEVEALYERVSGQMTSDGIFVVHTFPNLWHYKYEYARKRRIAASIGAYLPAEPRTRYERLMHINEQSPKSLQRQLARHFQHVLVWCGDLVDPAGTLAAPSIPSMRSAPDVFAVASALPLERDKIVEILRMLALSPVAGDLGLQVTNYPQHLAPDGAFEATVILENRSDLALKSLPPHPVNLSYHWLDESTGKVVLHDGIRTRLSPWLAPGQAEPYTLYGNAPSMPGAYVLRVTLVQEGVRWFDTEPTMLFEDRAVAVGRR